MSHSCIVLGGGGHAWVVVEILQTQKDVTFFGVLDSNLARKGEEISGVSILGGDGELTPLAQQGKIDSFVLGLGGAANNTPRRNLFEKAISLGLYPLSVVHATAVLSCSAILGSGVQRLALSVVGPRAVLGDDVIVNTGAIIEHDCRIGHHVHIATGARLASTVRVGDLAHIGAGATIRQGITIGAGAIVGAGAVVVKNVTAGETVIGSPARPLSKRTLDNPGKPSA